jgi:putative addiction module killer protein
MPEIRETTEFSNWRKNLRDGRAKERIKQRIARLEAGLFGDAKYFQGIGELRIDYGLGYRLYFVRRGDVVVILLFGGDKSSQDRDIQRAVAMAEEL